MLAGHSFAAGMMVRNVARRGSACAPNSLMIAVVAGEEITDRAEIPSLPVMLGDRRPAVNDAGAVFAQRVRHALRQPAVERGVNR